MKKIIVLIISFFAIITISKAESSCSYEEQRSLEQEAANVKLTYEPVKETTTDENGDVLVTQSIKISIYNITKNLYVTLEQDDVKNCSNCNKTFYNKDSKDGIVEFNWTNLSETASFTASVYSSDQTNCAHEKYKTLYLIIPRYNRFSEYAVCNELQDFYLCQEFVTFNSISEDEFLTQLTKFKNNEVDEKGEEVKQSFTDKLFSFINDYKYIIIGGFVVIGVTSFVIYRKTTKKQRELGL